MASRKRFTVYKRIINELGLMQLDVYRVVEDGKTLDIVRIYDPAKNKVFLVNLGVTREALTPLEFIEKLEKAASEAGVTLPERKLKQLKEAYAAKESVKEVKTA